MDPVDKKIDEILSLEAARDKAAQDAVTTEAAMQTRIAEEKRKFREETLFPVLDELDQKLRAHARPHFIEFDRRCGNQCVAEIRVGNGGGPPGVMRLALKFDLEENRGELGWVLVKGSVGDVDGRWMPEPSLTKSPYKLNAEQLRSQILALWFKIAGGKE